MAEPPVAVTYRGVVYKRNPDSDQRAHRVYYEAPRDSERTSLHRDIWKDTHPGEEIPPGWHVHHDDHDPFNNDPTNLVAVSPGDHGQEHKSEFADQRRDWINSIRPLASAWHGSPAGLAWHAENGRRAWENREPEHTKTCAECGNEFQSYVDQVAHAKTDDRYCSRRCVNRAREGKYLETIPCPVCGTDFTRDRCRKRPATCSRKCGAALRRQRAA